MSLMPCHPLTLHALLPAPSPPLFPPPSPPPFIRPLQPLLPSALINATSAMPPASALRMFRHAELSFALGCDGAFDESCPYWDHVVKMTVKRT
eukprot:116796-Chlamydomonas_euryale.AAC.1